MLWKQTAEWEWGFFHVFYLSQRRRKNTSKVRNILCQLILNKFKHHIFFNCLFKKLFGVLSIKKEPATIRLADGMAMGRTYERRMPNFFTRSHTVCPATIVLFLSWSKERNNMTKIAISCSSCSIPLTSNRWVIGDFCGDVYYRPAPNPLTMELSSATGDNTLFELPQHGYATLYVWESFISVRCCMLAQSCFS